MKIKMSALALTICFLLTGCINIEISVPGPNKASEASTQPTEDITTEVLDYPDTIGSDEEKLLTPLLPDEIFDTTAEDNGLDGTLYKIYGTVEDISANSDGVLDTIHLSTHKGNIVITNLAPAMEADSSFNELGTVDWNMVNALCPMPKIGEFCCIFAEYQGYSETYKAPYFSYGSSDFLSDIIISATSLG